MVLGMCFLDRPLVIGPWSLVLGPWPLVLGPCFPGPLFLFPCYSPLQGRIQGTKNKGPGYKNQGPRAKDHEPTTKDQWPGAGPGNAYQEPWTGS